MNIQGSATITRSDDGTYIGLRDPANLRALIFYKDGRILKYDDQESGSVVKGIAIANNGLSVCNFEIGSRSAVKILKIGNVISINNGGIKVGVLGFGRGISISQSTDDQNVPIDQKIAIGDPVAGRVSIFSITTSGVFSSSSSDIYAPEGMEFTGFGEKVGLSATGNSLAVAAPLYLENNEEIGCVLLYLYDSALSRWELVDSFIYGDVNNLRLGQGGVAVEDLAGRLDANDSAGDRVSYLVRFLVCMHLTLILLHVLIHLLTLFKVQYYMQ